MTTYERLIKVFNAVFEDDVDLSDVTESADLREDIGINSIGMLYMAMAIARYFFAAGSSSVFRADSFTGFCAGDVPAEAAPPRISLISPIPEMASR